MLGVVLGVVLLALSGTQAEVLRFEPAFMGNAQDSQQGVMKDEDSWPPKFCNGLDCPKFKVLNKTDDWELRQYDATKWVATTLTGVDFKEAQSTMFYRLFKYISGNNEKKMKIAMTCPVLTEIIPGPGPACESNFTQNFFISPSMSDPPKPTDPTVHFDGHGTFKAYIRSFGGFADLDKYLAEAEKLRNSLPEGAKVITSHYYVAGYDSPFKFWSRHNEVWFLCGSEE